MWSKIKETGHMYPFPSPLKMILGRDYFLTTVNMWEVPAVIKYYHVVKEAKSELCFDN